MEFILKAPTRSAKSLDYGSSFFGSSGEQGGVADANNIRADRGPSSFDIRHRAVFTYVIDLPVGPGHRLFGWNNGVNRQVLGGWQISGITTLQTGTPFTIFNDSSDFSGFNQFQRPARRRRNRTIDSGQSKSGRRI